MSDARAGAGPPGEREPTRDRDARRPSGGAAVDAVGEGALLLGRSLWEALRLRRFLSTTLAQAALVTTSSLVLLVGVSAAAGASCAVESVAITRQLGARGAVGGLTIFCALREMVPLVFAYVIALSVGSGLVADLATSGDGDPARRAAPRVLGVLVVFPLAYLVTVAGTFLGAIAIGVGRFGEVAEGTFLGLFLAFQDSTDLVFSAAKSLILTIFVVGAALLYGSRASAGDEAAGDATARFSLAAVVGVTVIGALLTLLLYGANPRIPAG